MPDLTLTLLDRLGEACREAGYLREQRDRLQGIIDAIETDDDGAAKVSRSAVEAVGDHYCRIIERLEAERDEAIAQQEALRESLDAHKQDTTALRHRIGVVVDDLLNSSRDGKIPVIKLYKMRDPALGLYEAKTALEASPWWARVEKLRALEAAAAREDVTPSSWEPWYPDDLDWVEHDGSGMPDGLDPGDTIEVLERRERVGRVWAPGAAPAVEWQFMRNGGHDYDIVAWRRV